MDSNGQWRWNLFQHLPRAILDQIKGITIETNSPMRLTCFWNLNRDGKFSVKSAYQVASSLNWNDVDIKSKLIWKLPAAQRVRTL